MDDDGIIQWLAGGVATLWLLITSGVSARLFKRVDKLETDLKEKADKDHIDTRLFELGGKVEAHDMRNANSHAKIFTSLEKQAETNAETRERVARIEAMVESLCDNGNNR